MFRLLSPTPFAIIFAYPANTVAVPILEREGASVWMSAMASGTRTLPSILAVSISVVLSDGSRKEVIGAQARAIIAAMTYAFACRQWPHEMFECNAVRAENMCANRHRAIPIMVSRSRPFPAAIGGCYTQRVNDTQEFIERHTMNLPAARSQRYPRPPILGVASLVSPLAA